MKFKTLGAAALLISLTFAVSCQKEDNSWKNIPYETVELASGNAAVLVNGVAATKGSVQLNAVSSKEGQLVMENVIPGYSQVSATVSLQKVDDSSFDFSGDASLNHPSIIISTRNGQVPSCYSLSVSGNITTDGKITLNAETKVQDPSLAGDWKIVRDSKMADNGETPLAGPCEIVWEAAGFENLSNVAALANMFLGVALGDVLNQVSFLENGNITAQYYPSDEMSLGTPDIDYNTGAVRYNAKHGNEWISSPAANYAFWYTAGDYIFVVPNLAEIAASQDETISIDYSGLNELSALGVDVAALAKIVNEIISNGVALHYRQNGDKLDIYADKDLCDAAVKALFAQPEKLDAFVNEYLAANPDNAMMIGMVMAMVGIEKPSDLLTAWNATSKFEIILHLTK